MDETELGSLVSAEIDAAISYSKSELDEDRKRATEYYSGKMTDLPAEVGLSRVVGPDRIEQEPVEFHERVRQSFRTLAEADPEHYLIVEATGTPVDVARLVRARVEPLLHQALRVTPTP